MPINHANAHTLLAPSEYPDVRDIFLQAFFVSRPARSEQYAVGMLHALRNRVAGEPFTSTPYQQGTVQFDAYMAGYQEGKNRWKSHQEEQAQMMHHVSAKEISDKDAARVAA